ncbi:MAG: flagellar hook-basal body complex protein [Selenomonadaceae bacterium]|nr:flagellar hook-basal body complex protein [Selenomonadaceae bacterium]
MMRSLFSGVSGLKSHQTRMDVIGNNIANINTVGFKGSRTTFSDMLSQTQSAASAPTDNLGGINPKQVGLGGAVASIDLIFNDSSAQQTGKNTDLALSGNALFVLKNGEQTYYTRDGAFEFDEAGNYVLPGSGLRVQGWNATEDGTINSNAISTDIVVPVGKTMAATATTNIDYAGNLNKEDSPIASIVYTFNPQLTDAEKAALIEGGTAVEGITPVITADADGNTTSVNVDGTNILAATIYLKNGEKVTVNSGYYEVGKTVPVTTLATIYDSLGGKHEITVLLDKDSTTEDENLTETAATNSFTGYTYTDGNGDTYPVTVTTDETTGTTTYTYVDSTGTKITVNETDCDKVYDNRWRVYIAPGVGQIGPASDEFTNKVEITDSSGSVTTATMNNLNFLYFDGLGGFISNGQTEAGAITFEYSNGNGADDNTAVIDFTGLTQYASNTTSFPTTNGNTSGILQSISIDSGGLIIGSYTNGLVRTEAQVAVAQFSNASGLTKVGTTTYTESTNSGVANIKTMADLGVSVVASALEMSNVDLASEFSDMIITQRGFQANSKITTVADEMIETLINMKR